MLPLRHRHKDTPGSSGNQDIGLPVLRAEAVLVRPPGLRHRATRRQARHAVTAAGILGTMPARSQKNLSRQRRLRQKTSHNPYGEHKYCQSRMHKRYPSYPAFDPYIGSVGVSCLMHTKSFIRQDSSVKRRKTVSANIFYPKPPCHRSFAETNQVALEIFSSSTDRTAIIWYDSPRRRPRFRDFAGLSRRTWQPKKRKGPPIEWPKRCGKVPRDVCNAIAKLLRIARVATAEVYSRRERMLTARRVRRHRKAMLAKPARHRPSDPGSEH